MSVFSDGRIEAEFQGKLLYLKSYRNNIGDHEIMAANILDHIINKGLAQSTTHTNISLYYNVTPSTHHLSPNFASRFQRENLLCKGNFKAHVNVNQIALKRKKMEVKIRENLSIWQTD